MTSTSVNREQANDTATPVTVTALDVRRRIMCPPNSDPISPGNKRTGQRREQRNQQQVDIQLGGHISSFRNTTS